MNQHTIVFRSAMLLAFAALLLLAPMLARAQVAHTEVELGADGALIFSVNGIALHVVGGAKVASTSVSSTALTLVLAPPTHVVIKAPDLNTMTVERASGDTDYTVDSVCNGTLSQKDITTGAATTTITITPDTGLCATGGGGGPGGSTPAPTSSGGGGGGAVVTTPAVTTPAAPAAPSAPSTQTTIATLLAQLQSLIALFQ